MEALESIDLGYDSFVPTNALTLKELPKLKSIVSRYGKKEMEAPLDDVPANYGKFTFTGLPALEVVQLNGTSLLNASEFEFVSLPMLNSVEIMGAGDGGFSRAIFSGAGLLGA